MLDVNKRTVSFSPPDISELEIGYVTETMRSGWITTGPKTKLFEKRISEWIGEYNGEGNPRCVCLNSGTASLELSLRLLGIGPQEGGKASDEVITCAYTYSASASVIAHVGAKIVLVDCSLNPDSVEMDYDALENAINENTKAIIPVDLGGIPCDYNRIYDIVERKRNLFKPESKLQKALGRIAVISDSAHAFGASYNGKLIGTIADFTCYSFHAVKNFTTAEGGGLLWNHIDGIDDDEIYHQLQLFSLHGQSKDALAKDKLGEWEYDIVGTWYKCNMTDITAAIGLGQLERYKGILERRKEIIECYDTAFKPLGINLLNHYHDGIVSSGHLYITGIPEFTREQSNEIIVEMAKRGITTNVHYKPLPMHTAYKKLGFDIKAYPNSYKRYCGCITIPCHTLLTDEDIEYVTINYTDILKKHMK